MCNKIAIGTVQFGLNYGISNQSGEVSQEEIHNILAAAKQLGIDCIDTANAYGNSQQKLGKEKLQNFQLVSKIVELDNITADFDAILNQLNQARIYALMVHQFQHFKNNPESFFHFQQLKLEGKVDKIGFSLNSLSELEELFTKKVNFDIVQLPFNILDTRFEKYFEKLNDLGVEIHVRSAFLQGLFFLKSDEFQTCLLPLVSSVARIQKLAIENGMSISELALKFVLSNPYISKVVVGVESEKQLRMNCESLDLMDSFHGLFDELKTLANNDENLILPMNWK